MVHLCFLLGCFQDFVLMCSLIKMCLGMDSFLLCASCIYKFMHFISSGIFSDGICVYRWRLDIFSHHRFRYCPLVFSLLSFLVFSTKCVKAFYFLPYIYWYLSHFPSCFFVLHFGFILRFSFQSLLFYSAVWNLLLKYKMQDEFRYLFQEVLFSFSENELQEWVSCSSFTIFYFFVLF